MYPRTSQRPPSLGCRVTTVELTYRWQKKQVLSPTCFGVLIKLPGQYRSLFVCEESADKSKWLQSTAQFFRLEFSFHNFSPFSVRCLHIIGFRIKVFHKSGVVPSPTAIFPRSLWWQRWSQIMSKILSLNVRVKVVMTLQLPAAIATRSLDSQTRSEFYGVCGLCVCVLSGFVTGSGASYRKERPVYHFIMLKKGICGDPLYLFWWATLLLAPKI